MRAFNPRDRQRFEQELRGNILPFWMEHTVDRVSGGFYGALTNDLRKVAPGRAQAVRQARIWARYRSVWACTLRALHGRRRSRPGDGLPKSQQVPG